MFQANGKKQGRHDDFQGRSSLLVTADLAFELGDAYHLLDQLRPQVNTFEIHRDLSTLL